MSYILDALKKAEQARSAGKAPDLFTLQASDSSARSRPLWPWLLAGLLILNGAGLFFWSQMRAPAGPPPAVLSTAPAPGPVAAAPALPLRAAITPPRAAAAAGEDLVDEEVAAVKLPPVNPPQPQPRAVEKTVAAPPAKSEATPAPAAPAPKPASPPPVPASTAAPAINQPPPLQTPHVTARPEPAQEPRVMAFSELPLAIQQELPKMAIAMHMYSGKPANRMTSINDKTLREGDELSPGLRLMEITADGMVWSYKGYRFKRGIN